MANGKKNGTIWKVIIGALVTLFLTALTFLLNTSWNAAGVVKDVEANTVAISETKKEIKEEVKPVVTNNKDAVIGIKKDIERLDEKMVDFKTEQTALRTEQQKAFKEILQRLPGG